eukprot:XP_016657172.1 PREDICTED: uncharacterized protein LOC107882781 isoform X1 [Acyrthosiphon pisum]
MLGLYKYTPMGGSSYIQLPNAIENKRATINPQNLDMQCFKWAILAKHVTGENKSRVSDNYIKHEKKYNFVDISFPTPLHQVKIFEKNNPNVSVNVYGIDMKSAEQRKTYELCNNCNLCKTKFSRENHKVADHCHLSGKFRQSLCNTCNLKLQTPNFVPVFFHNLSNYDAHFIVTRLGHDTNSISVIPNSEEKFITFSTPSH